MALKMHERSVDILPKVKFDNSMTVKNFTHYGPALTAATTGFTTVQFKD